MKLVAVNLSSLTTIYVKQNDFFKRRVLQLELLHGNNQDLKLVLSAVDVRFKELWDLYIIENALHVRKNGNPSSLLSIKLSGVTICYLHIIHLVHSIEYDFRTKFTMVISLRGLYGLYADQENVTTPIIYKEMKVLKRRRRRKFTHEQQ